MDKLRLDTAYLEAQMDALFVAFPELADDQELRADVLEGETELLPLVNRIVVRKLDARAMASAIKERKSDLSERQSRYERVDEAMGKLLKNILSRANLDKIVTPEATVSVTRPRESVSITDIDELPQGTFTTTRTADKKAIMDLIKAGEDVPGAALCFGEAGISVRVK